MRVRIVAMGRLRQGPELTLINDYLDRFAKTGRSLSLGPAEVIEVDDRKGGGKSTEGAALIKAIGNDDYVIALDERGKIKSSPEFAKDLADIRDQGHQTLSFVIGGADGLDQTVLNRAHTKLSFGMMVWPHMLVRVMMSEQLYRAASILSGGPYHRV